MPFATKEQKDEHNRQNYIKNKKRILLERKLAYIENGRAKKVDTQLKRAGILKKLEKYNND